MSPTEGNTTAKGKSEKEKPREEMQTRAGESRWQQWQKGLPEEEKEGEREPEMDQTQACVTARNILVILKTLRPAERQ